MPQDDSMEDGIEGPLFGPYRSFRVVYCREIVFGDAEDCTLEMDHGLIYYDGIYYDDWSVITGPLSDHEQMHWTAFDQKRASPPDDSACCCEQPGYFQSGVPGILAHMQDGRLTKGAAVERCDVCRRFSSDEAALERLIELGLGESGDEDPPQAEFIVRCHVVVRTEMPGVVAPDYERAVAVAKERFDWESQRNAARFDGRFFEFLVDGEDGVRRFPGTLGETDDTQSLQNGVTHE